MPTVSEQLKTRKAAAASTAKRTARVAAAKPVTEPEPEASNGKEASKQELTPEEKAAAKEARKQAAFEKLRELNAEKKAARKVELAARTKQVKGQLKSGQEKYLTRASYYGVQCVVQKVEEVRGKVLVTVECRTTKGGQELDPEDYYLRRVSPQFLQDEAPTEAYVPRRGGQVKTKKKRGKKASREESEVEAEDTSAEEEEAAEEEADEDEDTELEDESDEDEDTDEEEDEDTDEEPSESSDEVDEDSWA